MKDMHWMQLYHRELLAETIGWTAEEFGHYVRLLAYQWDHGQVPKDLSRLELISRGVAAFWKPLLAAKFPDGLNPRIADVRKHSEKLRTSKVENGRAGGLAKSRNRQAVANGVASVVATPLAKEVANEQAKPVANSYTSPSQSPEESDPSALDSVNAHPSGSEHARDRAVATSPGVLGSIGPSGRVQAESSRTPGLDDDRTRELRVELGRRMRSLVDNPMAQLDCLAALDRMTPFQVRRARRDFDEVKDLESPGGALHHRWTTTAAPATHRRMVGA